MLRSRGATVISAGRPHDGSDIDLPLDLADLDNLRGVVDIARPDVVYHLAAQAFVPEATKTPLATYDVNINGTARLYEAIRLDCTGDRPLVVFVSSAEVYGSRDAGDYPLHEGLTLQPATPYAASKAAGEAIALASWRTYRIPSIVTRAFNHIGPGQNARFAVPAFADQLAAIADGAPPVLLVGNLSPQRDFLDVRDVVEAYVTLAQRGRAGEIYNVCSGRPVAIQEVLRELITIAHVPVEVREDPARMRPSDVPISYGDSAKLQAATGWLPRFGLAASLRDIFADARDRHRAIR